MENNENFVAEQVTENVEQTTEQTPKMFTQDEVNDIVGKAKARTRAKIEKDYQRKYGDLESVLKAGTGKESVEEMTDTFKQFYVKKGIQIPEKPRYSDRDIEVLAKAEAEDIIRGGYEEVVEEVERLAQVGAANMTPREKAVFRALAEHRQSAERGRELSKLGVTEDVYKSKEFADFASKFNPTVSVSEIYEIYKGKQPKKDIKPMGSMKQAQSEQRDYFTPEEIERLTMEDLDDPVVWEKARRSMTGR